VAGLSIDVARGEIFGFLGPNGAGKTTTQRLLTGILQPTAGRIHIMGHDLLKTPMAAKISVGVVPENANPYRDLSAWHNLMLMGRLYGLEKKQREKKAAQLLAFFGLLERRKAKTKTLSKGLNQRISLAMALIHDPRLLFLDEPTSGLDVESARLIRDLIVDLNGRGVTVFLTTHDMEEAARLCDRVAIICRGRVAAIDSPDVLRADFSSVQSVEVVFEKPLDDATVLAGLGPVNEVRQHRGKYTLFTDQPGEVACRVALLARERDFTILSLNTCAPRLEDVFVHLTGGKAQQHAAQ
jgi:ABC-2 type transport system ATP-binding protein